MSIQQENLFEYAEQQMNRRFLAGEKEEAALIEQVAKTVIVDRLVPPDAMRFWWSAAEGLKLEYNNAGILKQVVLHRHAFGQLCSKVGLPLSYANMLQSSGDTDVRRALYNCQLANDLNGLYHTPAWEERSGAPVRFLHRIVGDELRAFVSRRFNRHLASAPLLRSFVEACRKNNARPIEAATTAVRVSLKYLLPKTLEAFPGENVCFGTEFSNSEFGAGRTTVRSTVWRANSGTSSVLDEAFARIHIGSVIEDSDIEVSNETAHKELVAQQGAIHDAVMLQLKQETVGRLLTAIRLAHEDSVPWSKLRPQLAKFLGKAEQEMMEGVLYGKIGSIIELPPVSVDADGARMPNTYWASAYVGVLASRTEDVDRRLELQKEAGKLLGNAVRDT